jgi:signal transduction histidine kinase
MIEDNHPDDGIDYDIDYKDLLLTLLHEAHVINNVINSYSEIISRAVGGEKIDKNAIEDHVHKIVENVYLLSLLLNRTEFEINPSYFENQLLLPEVSLHGKFKKAIINLKQIAKNKKIHMSYTGASSGLLSLYPIIDLLPYLLLENALKYSPKESHVSVNFIETFEFVDVSVSSIGPALRFGELDHIFDKGFRGYEATKMVKQGNGRGLALAKHICNIHNAEIKIEMGPNEFTFSGVPHSNFIVKIKFPRH